MIDGGGLLVNFQLSANPREDRANRVQQRSLLGYRGLCRGIPATIVPITMATETNSVRACERRRCEKTCALRYSKPGRAGSRQRSEKRSSRGADATPLARGQGSAIALRVNQAIAVAVQRPP